MTILVVCFLSVEVIPSTSKVRSYVFKDSGRNLSQHGVSQLLFVQHTKDSLWVVQPYSIKLKDPYMAIFYAFIPGLVIHGSGHFYAGKTETGFWLLGAEVAGVSIVYVSALAGYAASEAGRISEVAEFGAIGGLLLFVGSWVYDVVKSPLVVKEQNQKLLQRRQGQLNLKIKDGSLKVVVACPF